MYPAGGYRIDVTDSLSIRGGRGDLSDDLLTESWILGTWLNAPLLHS